MRLACLLFLAFFLFTAGFVALVSAVEPDQYNYTTQLSNNLSIFGKVGLPVGDYPIWGYNNTCYNFYETCNVSENFSNTTMVFYWDCLNNSSYYSNFTLDDTSHQKDVSLWECNNTWNKTGNYSVAVGVFKPDGSKEASFWIPIKIINDTTITVKSFFMLDEQNGNATNYITDYNHFNFSNLFNNSGNWSEKKYCGYIKNSYSFSVILNATSQSDEDNRTINETTAEVYWGDNTSDSNVIDDINNTENFSENNSRNVIYIWAEDFTHEWNKTGEKNISATAFHWDPLVWNERYSNCNNTSILIIRDPKNFVSFSNPVQDPSINKSFFSLIISLIEPFSNIQNWGLFLIIIGLMILFFTYKKNSVPVKISLFGLKPFDLGSVDFFIGIFTFVAGMYLYFVFGRCPWDIPIISSLPYLPDAYFSMLYYEYQTLPEIIHKTDDVAVPYLSILLCLTVVFALSIILYRIGVPILNKLKNVKFLIIEGISMLRSSIYRLSVILKKFSIQIKENIRNINLPYGKATGLQEESGKKEKV